VYLYKKSQPQPHSQGRRLREARFIYATALPCVVLYLLPSTDKIKPPLALGNDAFSTELTQGTNSDKSFDNTSENRTGRCSINACTPSAASPRDVRSENPRESRTCCPSMLSAPCHNSALVHATAVCDVFAASSWANARAAGSTSSRFGNVAWYNPCRSGESGEYVPPLSSSPAVRE
jgi:hypothetical protein